MNGALGASCLCFAVLVLAQPSMAADLSQEYQACRDSTETKQVGANATEEIERQEKWLSEAWRDAAAAMRETVADLAEYRKSRAGAASPSQLMLDGQLAWVIAA